MCFAIFVSISPYVIGTMNQGVSSSPNLELHHNFRFVTKLEPHLVAPVTISCSDIGSIQPWSLV